MFRSILLFLLILTAWRAHANGPILSFETKETVALQRATDEGKNVFIIFKAQWCTPCRWMETTTLRNEAVQSSLLTYYVPVKADIDEGDGFVLFDSHDVQVLPTMIILDQNGQVLERVEESLGSDKLLQILQRHSKDLNPVSSNIPITTVTSSDQHQDLVTPIGSGEADSDFPSPQSSRKSFETFSAPPADGYAVQVGVYTLFPNVLSKILDIQAIQDGPFHVEESRINDVVVYKLLSGHFATRSEAEAWRASLAEARIPGYIRDLRRS